MDDDYEPQHDAWFEVGRHYESKHKPGEFVWIAHTWTYGGLSYAAGQFVLGPRTGESWSRVNVDDVFHAYELYEKGART